MIVFHDQQLRKELCNVLSFGARLFVMNIRTQMHPTFTKRKTE